jgi:hypothetical protein
MAIAGTALAPAASADQLPCVPAARTDGQPWVHRSRVLESFPQVSPAPTAVGTYQDKDGEFSLALWRDEHGYFGELSSPVLDADSPTSRLRDVAWRAGTRELRFAASPGGVELRMAGTLVRHGYVVSQLSGKPVHGLVLRKAPHSSMYDWRSRAQFECAMKLWARD